MADMSPAQTFSSGSIGSWLADLRSTVSQISGTGVAIIQARQQVRNAQADSRNTDGLNVRIASSASPDPTVDVYRQRRDALTAGLTSGPGAQLGQTAALPIWLIAAMAGVAFVLLKS
jgi:hypothetical protein